MIIIVITPNNPFDSVTAAFGVFRCSFQPFSLWIERHCFWSPLAIVMLFSFHQNCHISRSARHSLCSAMTTERGGGGQPQWNIVRNNDNLNILFEWNLRILQGFFRIYWYSEKRFSSEKPLIPFIHSNNFSTLSRIIFWSKVSSRSKILRSKWSKTGNRSENVLKKIADFFLISKKSRFFLSKKTIFLQKEANSLRVKKCELIYFKNSNMIISSIFCWIVYAFDLDLFR